MKKEDNNAVDEKFPDDFYPYDKEDVRDFYKHIVNNVQDAYKVADLMQHNFKTEEIDEIVFAGMGGSAITGIIMKDYLAELNPELKIKIANSYKLPKISKNALVICISYSGRSLSSFLLSGWSGFCCYTLSSYWRT